MAQALSEDSKTVSTASLSTASLGGLDFGYLSPYFEHLLNPSLLDTRASCSVQQSFRIRDAVETVSETHQRSLRQGRQEG